MIWEFQCLGLQRPLISIFGSRLLKIYLKARSHDSILRIRFLVPKIGSRRSDGPILRFRFCGENFGRSFVVCSHDPILRIRFLVPKLQAGIHTVRFQGSVFVVRMSESHL